MKRHASVSKQPAKKARVFDLKSAVIGKTGDSLEVAAFCGNVGDTKEYIAFGSKTKCPELSNFYECSITITFPAVDYLPQWMHGFTITTVSAEHMWHFIRCAAYYDVECVASQNVVRGFSVGGALTQWQGPNKNVGLVAKQFMKMKTSECVAKYNIYNYRKLFFDNCAIWELIHLAKYQQNPDLKSLLLATDKYLLVEQVRWCQPVQKAHLCYWGAFVSRKAEHYGKIYGVNHMGQRMMHVRDLLCQPPVQSAISPAAVVMAGEVSEDLEI